ncbi:MAG: thiamine pyrophosphate-dependent enzyme [Gemmatimonadales bacterium]
MKRRDALEAIYPELERSVVVTIMGAVSAEPRASAIARTSSTSSMPWRLASSVGLGIALSRPDAKVVVLDGDGSVLMNLGGLTTLARYRPRNLVHVVFDNESLLSVGGFPTATATGTNLAGIAREAGVPRTATATDLEGFGREFRAALAADELTTLVAKVEAVGPAGFITDLEMMENKFQFRRCLAGWGRPPA